MSFKMAKVTAEAYKHSREYKATAWKNKIHFTLNILRLGYFVSQYFTFGLMIL